MLPGSNARGRVVTKKQRGAGGGSTCCHAPLRLLAVEAAAMAAARPSTRGSTVSCGRAGWLAGERAAHKAGLAGRRVAAQGKSEQNRPEHDEAVQDRAGEGRAGDACWPSAMRYVPVKWQGGAYFLLKLRPSKARRKDKEASTPCPDDPKLYLEEAVLERKLPDVDLRVLVDLPAGLDYNEWLASHTIAFFDHINLVYGTISEFCTMSGCPDMTGPGLRTYLWFDDKGKKTRVAAPQYIDYVMTFTQKTISDESIFPTKYANEFPSSFESIVRKILRLLFHVLAHLYHCHFREVVLLNLHAHLNCVFAHLTLFNHRFQLIEPKETDILHDLEVALRVHADCHRPAAGAGAATSDDATGADEAAATAAGAEEETGADANEDGDAATPPTPASASGPGSAAQGDAGAGARDALLSDLTLAPAPAPAPPPAPAPDAQQVA